MCLKVLKKEGDMLSHACLWKRRVLHMEMFTAPPVWSVEFERGPTECGCVTAGHGERWLNIACWHDWLCYLPSILSHYASKEKDPVSLKFTEWRASLVKVKQSSLCYTLFSPFKPTGIGSGASVGIREPSLLKPKSRWTSYLIAERNGLDVWMSPDASVKHRMYPQYKMRCNLESQPGWKMMWWRKRAG